MAFVIQSGLDGGKCTITPSCDPPGDNLLLWAQQTDDNIKGLGQEWHLLCQAAPNSFNGIYQPAIGYGRGQINWTVAGSGVEFEIGRLLIPFAFDARRPIINIAGLVFRAEHYLSSASPIYSVTLRLTRCVFELFDGASLYTLLELKDSPTATYEQAWPAGGAASVVIGSRNFDPATAGIATPFGSSNEIIGSFIVATLYGSLTYASGVPPTTVNFPVARNYGLGLLAANFYSSRPDCP